ncbi:MAG: NAD(P)-dependent oxidoreductase [Pelagibacteraceae bacterium]|nr:NAD(P)-dependent oxidoreductase [Pelagibacteraceae bacterium]
MKVLLTGGVGYLGTHITKKLLDDGHTVIVFDNFTHGYYNHDFRAHIIVDDMKNIINYDTHFKDVDVVFHLAAPRLQHINSSSAVDECVDDLKVLYEICVKNKIKKFVFPSSCSVYGFVDGVVTEEDDVNITSHYAELKHKSEILLNNFNEIPTIIARQATLFGVSDLMRYDLMINDFVNSVKNKKSFDVYGKDTWRPNLDVSDCANILLKLINIDFEGVVNVGSNDLNSSKQDVIDEMLNVINDVSKYVSYANNEDVRSYKVDFSKLNNLIEYKCISLNKGIRMLYEYSR